MSYMSDLALEVDQTIIDATCDPDVVTEDDILAYVNKRIPISVTWRYIETVLHREYGEGPF